MRKGYKKCEYVLWYTDAACRRNSKSAIVELIDVDAKKKKVCWLMLTLPHDLFHV